MSRPRVSLLVAMRNEAGYIEHCLASVFTQDYPAERLEVWVLDGESTDGSRQIAGKLCEGRSNCHVISNPGITQAEGWNLGIERSTGDVIGILSAHAELARDYVSKAVETLQRTGADLVGGPMHATAPGRVGRAIALATSTPFGMGSGRFHYTEREEEVDTVYMGLCWREMYRRVGRFDVRMVRNQDDELSYRLRRHGGRIICNPAIRSRYHNRTTFRSLWRQYFQYGYWKVEVMRRHPRQMRLRQFVPPTFVAVLLSSTILSVFEPLGWWLLALTGGVYGLTSLACSVWTARDRNWWAFPLLPMAFATLHVGYGLGFLKGGMDYLIRRWQGRSNLAQTIVSE